jgi:alpha-tubulin suppressor-like RCC1 family protein
LGDNTRINKLKPTFVFQENDILKDKKIIQISSGYEHSLILSDSGEIFAFGNNLDYQLGDGTQENKIKPILIFKQQNIIKISSGYKK